MKTMAFRLLIVLTVAGAIFCPAINKASAPVQGEVLDAYLRAFPEVKNIGIIYSQPKYEEIIVNLAESAGAKEVKVIKVKVPSIKEFSETLGDMKGKVDTFWVIDESLFTVQEVWNYFMMFTFRHRIKTVVFTENALALGGLFYYTEDKETMVNKRILDVLGCKVSEKAGPVKYYSGKSGQENG
jgi:hypothetical protein